MNSGSKFNWVARLTNFFMNNQQLAIMLFVLIIIAGIASFNGLRREGFPKVPVKVAIVQTTYRGAAPAEIEQSVTTPIENALKGNRYIQDTSSQSLESASVITAIIEPGANLEAAIQEITTRVGSVELPNGADKPKIEQPNTGNAAFTYGLGGDLSQQDLVNQANIFAREISQVKGVKDVDSQVEINSVARITLDPAKLVSNRVDVTQINQSIAAGNVSIPAGIVTNEGVGSTVIFNGRYPSIEALNDIRLPAASGSVRLGDVASIEEGVDTDDKLLRIGYIHNGLLVGETGIAMDVRLRDDADILSSDEEIIKAVERLRTVRILSDKLTINRIFDEAASTRQQIDEIRAGAFGEQWRELGAFAFAGILFGGIWLLAIVMAVFVNVRAALVAALSVPLSFLITVIALYVQGVTLNTLTLFSMILVLGLVVDPIIVVLEALQRYKDRGFQGREAALRAVDSVGLGVLMAVLISVIVFTPFGIVSGVFGEIIRFIPITVIPALIASFFVPILFLTAIGNKILKTHHKSGTDTSEEASLWRSSLWFQRVNRSILRRWWLQVGIIALAAILPLAIAGSLFATQKIKSVQFSSPSDSESLLVSQSYPQNWSDEKVLDLAQQSEEAIKKHPEIKSYFYISQNNGNFNIFINLSLPRDREVTSGEIVSQLQRNLPQKPGSIYASAQAISAGPPTPEFPVQLQIFETDTNKLEKFTIDAGAFLSGVDGVKRVSDGYSDGAADQVVVTPNRPTLAANGIEPEAVGGQLTSIFSSRQVTNLQLSEGTIAVELELGGSKPASVDQIKQLTIQSPKGPIALGSVATVELRKGSGSIQHFNGNRYATVRAELYNNGDTIKSAEVQKTLNDWADQHRQQYGLREGAFTNKGENEDIAESFTQLFLALGAAILLTYVVLAVFFRSFLQPLIITFAVPLSFIGVFPALYFFGGGQFGFLEILGMITLVGIVENVGIFVIDYANRRVREGMDYRDAIALATAVRFRPIFLTKVCALGSLLPLAIISPFWRGLASVIVAGILTSGIVSLFTTPILYHWTHKLQNFGRRLKNRKLPVEIPQTVSTKKRPIRL